MSFNDLYKHIKHMCNMDVKDNRRGNGYSVSVGKFKMFVFVTVYNVAFMLTIDCI